MSVSRMMSSATLATNNFAGSVLWMTIFCTRQVGVSLFYRKVLYTIEHFVENFERVKASLDVVLHSALKEIKEKMINIDEDISRIRKARSGDKRQRRKERREVVTYHEGFARLNKSDHDIYNSFLFGEEITLEQYYLDLKQLCLQIEKILALSNCAEMVRNVLHCHTLSNVSRLA